MKKYLINYGFGYADFYTDALDVEDRFYTLAGTCFGIRKSIWGCNIIKVCEDDREETRYEELAFNGDRYIWRDDGARKMIEPWADEEWDVYYCEECRSDA